ncbi:MAG: DUF1801 domain-containing protein [Thermoanaerobaculia bacterium]|nr:DUF1801 domain-containing protein [Thermoanaerobaculia bacterium]
MAELKTKPTGVSVKAYLDAIEDEARRKDCRAIAALMKRVTGCSPKMWGPSIVGFGSYHYEYASGHSGDMCLTGFSSRGREIVVYLMAADERAGKLFAALGKHRRGKSCLYFKRLADVDLPVLEQLVALSCAETRRRYPEVGRAG